MVLFILAIAVVFAVTGTCALVEAALYAVRRTYIEELIEQGFVAGIRLKRFKEKMDYPITAILIFDTLLGVGGAAIAGSQARMLYGEAFVYWFTLVMAATLLVFAQIVPKIVGVAYSQPVARSAAMPIAASIWLLYPVVRLIEFFTRHLKPEGLPKRAPEKEVRQMARISHEEGSILGIEADLIQNSLRLDDVYAKAMMTPIENVVAFPNNMTVREAFEKFRSSSHSRIPLHTPAQPRQWTHLVFSRDLLSAMARDEYDLPLSKLARPMHFVSADLRGHELLDAFLKKRTHLFAVRDAGGNSIGVISLEDVMEEILGREIEDEKDLVLPDRQP